MEGWSPRERAAAAKAFPLDTLGAVLGRDDHFLDTVEAARRDAATIQTAARRYAPKEGRGRQVIVHMLKAAALEADRRLAGLRVMNLTPAVWVDDDPTAGERERWIREGASYRAGAIGVARRGAGFCLEASCFQQLRPRELWCWAHEPPLAAEKDAQVRRMRVVLDGAARALDL